jgi:hypothetical protein
VRRLAVDAIGADSTHATLDETGPHSSVDAARIRTLDDEGTERTRGRLQFCLLALDGQDRSLKAERPEGTTHLLEPSRDVLRGLQAGGGGKPAAELLPCPTKGCRPAPNGNPLDQEGNQLGQAPVGELDPYELRGDAVHLRRAPGSRATSAAASLERDSQESRLDEPIEPAAGDVSVHPKVGRCLSDGKRFAPAAGVQEDPPKLRIARRCKAVERHGRKTYPAARYEKREIARKWQQRSQRRIR